MHVEFVYFLVKLVIMLVGTVLFDLVSVEALRGVDRQRQIFAGNSINLGVSSLRRNLNDQSVLQSWLRFCIGLPKG